MLPSDLIIPIYRQTKIHIRAGSNENTLHAHDK